MGPRRSSELRPGLSQKLPGLVLRGFRKYARSALAVLFGSLPFGRPLRAFPLFLRHDGTSNYWMDLSAFEARETYRGSNRFPF
jgi:hypothetical protein